MKRYLLALAPAALAVLAGSLTLRFGLDSWFVADDFWHLAYVRMVDSPYTSLFKPMFGDMAFRPLTFIVNFHLANAFGTSPRSAHIQDLVLHLVNTVLLYVLALRFLALVADRGAAAGQGKDVEGEAEGEAEGEEQAEDEAGEDEEDEAVGDAPAPADGAGRPSPLPVMPALAAALLFAVHPVTNLTAGWHCCRADLLATAFSLSAMALALSRTAPGVPRLAASGTLALMALLCKVTHLPLFLIIFVLALAAKSPAAPRQRLRQCALAAMPAFAATVIYLAWRLLVLGGMGGYGVYSDGLAGLWAEAAYNVPRVVGAAARDLALHDAIRDDMISMPLAVCGAALLLLGGPGAFSRNRRGMLAALAFICLALFPAWNVAHMFAVREERLLYLPMAGFALLIGAVAHGPRSWHLRAASLGAVALAAAAFAFVSHQALGDWHSGAREGRRLARALADYIEPKGPASTVRRVYVLGAESDAYYLDMMVKTELGSSFHDREIMPGDRPSFIWTTRESRRPLPSPEQTPAEALPEREVHRTDPDMILETVHPPDLIDACFHDRGARALKWDGDKLTDLTGELKLLYGKRERGRDLARSEPRILPSFSLRKSPMPFLWRAGGDLEIGEPLNFGEPYLLVSRGNDPYLLSPVLDLDALWPTGIEFEMTVPARSFLPPAERGGSLMWLTRDGDGFTAERSYMFEIIADGKPHNYKIDLGSNVYWARSRNIHSLRIDPMTYPATARVTRLLFTIDED